MALPARPRRIRLALGLATIAIALASVVVVRVVRAPAEQARRIAAQLTDCPWREVGVELVGADVETWRVRACGRTGLLICEPTDDACFFAPDDSAAITPPPER